MINRESDLIEIKLTHEQTRELERFLSTKIEIDMPQLEFQHLPDVDGHWRSDLDPTVQTLAMIAMAEGSTHEELAEMLDAELIAAPSGSKWTTEAAFHLCEMYGYKRQNKIIDDFEIVDE